MAVVLETTLGDITIDLYVNSRPKACLNFLKLCKMKYYNFNLFHTVNQGFIAQTGDPTGTRDGGESIWAVMDGPDKRYFEAENVPRIKHTTTGLVSFVGDKDNLIGSQFFITLASDLTYLDAQHCVFGEVGEGFDVLRALNEAICDTEHRPYKDIRITHTVVLDDPFPDPDGLKPPDRSPERTADRLAGGRIAPDEDVDETEGKTAAQIAEMIAEREAKARATILEMVGDIPDAEMAPPENVLFVCKLNPVTTDDDLEIIFSRFGKIKSCEVIRDKKTGDSLQYAFVEFEEQKSCEDAYFKMDNVLIDDRRIHVDFSQSVAKIKWLGKGRGVVHYDNNKKEDDSKLDTDNNGKQQPRSKKSRQDRSRSRSRDRSYERSRDRRDYRERSRDRRNGNYRQSNYNNYYNNNYNNRQMQYRGRRGGGGGYYQNQRYQMNNYRYRNEYDNRYHRNHRPRQNYRDNQIATRRRYDDRRYRSRSHDRRSSSRTRTTRRSLTPDDPPVVEKRKKYDESDEEKFMKKDTTTPEEKRVKKNKKKSKSKKKKKYSSDSDSSSESSANERKAKKKKSKKRDSSSESDTDSDASPKKKSRK